MSNENFSTAKSYLKLAYSETHSIIRPGNTFSTQYDYPLLYTSSNYNPMVLSFYTSNSGLRFPCPAQYGTNSLPPDGAIASVFATPSAISVIAVGNPADATTYTLSVELFVLHNSVLEP